MEIKFKRDTAFRKQFFVPDSFAHPAKMDAQLLIWIVEKYTAEGETILDPMAGSGTTMLACGLGRNCILVELEDKFCKMMADNWNEDTIKLCEQAGFTYLERHYRKLTAQSFWRTIYHQKHPEVEQINHEDILVFTQNAPKCKAIKELI